MQQNRPDIDDFIDPYDMRHDLASVAGALNTLLETRGGEFAQPVQQLLRLCSEKVHRTMESMDMWVMELEKNDREKTQ